MVQSIGLSDNDLLDRAHYEWQLHCREAAATGVLDEIISVIAAPDETAPGAVAFLRAGIADYDHFGVTVGA